MSMKYNGGDYTGKLVAILDKDNVRHLLSTTEITAAALSLGAVSVQAGGTAQATLTISNSALAGQAVTWSVSGSAATVPSGAAGTTVTVTGVSAGNATLKALVAGLEVTAGVTVTEAEEPDEPVMDVKTAVYTGSVTSAKSNLRLDNNVMTLTGDSFTSEPTDIKVEANTHDNTAGIIGCVLHRNGNAWTVVSYTNNAGTDVDGGGASAIIYADGTSNGTELWGYPWNAIGKIKLSLTGTWRATNVTITATGT